MTRPGVFLCLTLLPLVGCPGEDPASSPKPVKSVPKPDTIPRISVKDGQGLLFSFYDNRAEMRTVETTDEVAETARSDVMVTDPRTRLPGDLIVVADLRKKDASGVHRSWVETKSKWLDRVVPKKSLLTGALAQAEPAPTPTPTPKKKRRHRRRRRRRRPKAAAPPAAGAPAATPAVKAQVILFTTAWCPSCKTARRFFQSKGVPFRELDVERNQQAQQQYLAIQRSYRLRPGVVPLIIVNGRIFQGFSRPQVEAALAAGPPKG